MNQILTEDIRYIHSKVDFKQLEGSTVLVTGATGLIGSLLVQSLLEWNKNTNNKIHVIAAVRSKEKAERVFQDYSSEELRFVVSDVQFFPLQDLGVEYIIHGASVTSSKSFVDNPVEITMTAIEGTYKMLEFARINHAKSFVYLSSMEVYGTPATDEKIYESHSTNLLTTAVRSCYPESKRMCENLCVSYHSEYNVPAKIVRLTQTFGTGVPYHDGRVFAEFARCVIEGRDIILKTKGETKRSYLYTADAATAILTVLLKGEEAAAYNAANESSYCSIYEMACAVSALSQKHIQVQIEENADINKLGYAPTLKMNLSTDKLMQLEWKPEYSLIQMFERMIETMI